MSKEERKKIEKENIKILNSLINKKSHFEELETKKKIHEYSSLIKELEKMIKSFPEEDKTKNYYKEYIDQYEKVSDALADIYFEQKEYKQVIDIDKKILKNNNKFHKSFKRLYYSFWELGDKESAVIYGSFILYTCDKKIRDKYYKDIIPEIQKNLHQVAKDYQNKSWLSELKITKKGVIRFIFFIISVIYLIKNKEYIGKIFN